MAPSEAKNPIKKTIKLCTCEILAPGYTRNGKEIRLVLVVLYPSPVHHPHSRKVSLYIGTATSLSIIFTKAKATLTHRITNMACTWGCTRRARAHVLVPWVVAAIH